MEQRPLGSQGLYASAQSLGCMGMSSAYVDKDHVATEEESIATIHRALELGVNMLDSADVYGPFTNEPLLGKAIQGQRDKYVIATKFGLLYNAQGACDVQGSKEYVRSACEGSLKRLGIDQIDLYYQHRQDTSVTLEETVTAIKALVDNGSVKYVGLSEISAADIRRAHAITPISAVQVEWSLWARDVEKEIVPTCRELGIGIVAYSPLGRGFFTGKLNKDTTFDAADFRSYAPRFQGDAFQKNLKMLERVSELAKSKGCTPGQLALAWVHHQGRDVFPIPGTKRVKYLEENVAAFSIALSREELQLLEDAVSSSEVAGDRYPQGLQQMNHDAYSR